MEPPSFSKTDCKRDRNYPIITLLISTRSAVHSPHTSSIWRRSSSKLVKKRLMDTFHVWTVDILSYFEILCRVWNKLFGATSAVKPLPYTTLFFEFVGTCNMKSFLSCQTNLKSNPSVNLWRRFVLSLDGDILLFV